MTATTSSSAVTDPRAGVPWPVGGLLLDAIARRDFAAMASCLDPDVRFRALVPRGLLEASGPAQTVGWLREWFGGEDEFEVEDASIGQVGTRLYLRWRVRMRSAGDPACSRVVEQHVFATVGERIESMHLLCSGFHEQRAAAGRES